MIFLAFVAGLSTFTSPSVNGTTEKIAIGSSYLVNWSQSEDNLSITLELIVPTTPVQIKELASGLSSKTTAYKWVVPSQLTALPGYKFRLKTATTNVDSASFELTTVLDNQKNLTLSNAIIGGIVIACFLFLLLTVYLVRKFRTVQRKRTYKRYEVPKHLSIIHSNSLDDIKNASAVFDEEWRSRSSWIENSVSKERKSSIFDDPRLTKSVTLDSKSQRSSLQFLSKPY